MRSRKPNPYRKTFGIFDPPKSKVEKQITNEIEAITFFIIGFAILIGVLSTPIVMFALLFT